MRRANAAAAVIAGVVILLLAGCGKKKEASPEVSERKTEFKEIWEVYNLFIREKKRAPTNLADLKPYALGFSEGIKALRDGQCVVIWGVDPYNTSDAASKVFAYEKDVPQQGGLVLLASGRIKSMTAEEFQAAPKVK